MFTVLELWSSCWMSHQWPLTCWNWRGASRRPAPDPCCWGSSGAGQPAGRTPLRSGPCPQNFPTLPGKAKGKRNTLSAPEDIQRGGGRVFRFDILKTHVPTSLLETLLQIFPNIFSTNAAFLSLMEPCIEATERVRNGPAQLVRWQNLHLSH